MKEEKVYEVKANPMKMDFCIHHEAWVWESLTSHGCEKLGFLSLKHDSKLVCVEDVLERDIQEQLEVIYTCM